MFEQSNMSETEVSDMSDDINNFLLTGLKTNRKHFLDQEIFNILSKRPTNIV